MLTHCHHLAHKTTWMLLPPSYAVILYFYSWTLMLKQPFHGSVQLPVTVSAFVSTMDVDPVRSFRFSGEGVTQIYTDFYVVLLNSGANNHNHISLIAFYASLMKHLSGSAQGLTSVKLLSTPTMAICFQIWLYIL